MPKYTKEEKAQQARGKALQTADEVVERAQGDRMRKARNYHADSMHGFSDERVLEILKSPDAVYHSTAGSGRLIFRHGEDIVVAEGRGAGAGNVITAYGPSGIRGDSGASARRPPHRPRWADHPHGRGGGQDSGQGRLYGSWSADSMRRHSP
ncbi:hypothetical protein ACIRPP_13065 [Streptomyces sp. NPDC101219]|uniref:hypothetical protein n=1 Tax=Streptomyces sp. NPDC101219 TaxID=3366131 RepID=UPI0037F5D483